MLNRRLAVLFTLFVLGFAAIALRLGHLQISQGRTWQEKLRASLQAPEQIETARGAILDCNGVALAFDRPSYYLAINYRAMNQNDRWLARLALDRMSEQGVKFASREERKRWIVEAKAHIADQIAAIPEAIAQHCDTAELLEPSPDAKPLEKVLAQFQKIRQTIESMRTALWNQTAKPGEDPDAVFHRLLGAETLEHTILSHITDEQAFYFKEHAEEYPGLMVCDAKTRVYPFKTTACQVVGTLRAADQKMVKENPLRLKEAGNLAGYSASDLVGEGGMEKVLEPQLHGVRGVRLEETDVSDDAAPSVDENTAASPDRQIDPVPGKDVRLTLDITLQRDIEAALADPHRDPPLLQGDDKKEHFVALVVLSLDGRVLAMISMPEYDPNQIDTIRTDLMSDEWRRPLANRALQAYQPGSTVKPLMAAAALTEKLITPETTTVCNGYLFPNRPLQFRCEHVHGALQLSDALAYSCNVYFYTVGGKLGVDRIAAWLSNYGAGRETGLELPDQNGSLPKAHADADTDLGESLLLGIGQGPVAMTPLQMANAYATLLRGGKFISPRIVAGAPPKVVQTCTISQSNLAVVMDGMHRVTTVGTGKQTFRGFRLPVGGKTGTADTHRPAFDDEGHAVFDAERPLKNADGSLKMKDGQPQFARVSQDGTDAWFVGYAPADHPKFVVAAVMEFGGFGGARAAPMVREAFVELEKHGYLPADDVP